MLLNLVASADDVDREFIDQARHRAYAGVLDSRAITTKVLDVIDECYRRATVGYHVEGGTT